jgi:hypothetical protein
LAKRFFFKILLYSAFTTLLLNSFAFCSNFAGNYFFACVLRIARSHQISAIRERGEFIKILEEADGMRIILYHDPKDEFVIFRFTGNTEKTKSKKKPDTRVTG